MLTLSSPQTLSKRMGTMVQLIGPHTPTEAERMARLLFQVDLEGGNDTESNSELKEESYLKERVTEMGPLVREVFAKDAYNQFLGDRPVYSHGFLPYFMEMMYSSLPVGAT
jgi:hypothetical protein